MIVGRLKPGSCYLKGHVNKRVFCVSNVHRSFSANDLSFFIEAMGVEVVDCSATKFTGSFHVSIAARHADHFCWPGNWPEHVTIRPWVFKPKKTPSNVPSPARPPLKQPVAAGDEQPPQDETTSENMDTNFLTTGSQSDETVSEMNNVSINGGKQE